MKTRKTNTSTTTKPRKYPKPATLLSALAAMTMAGVAATEARTVRADPGATPVTVISGDRIGQQGITDAGELINALPGTVGETYTAGNTPTGPSPGNINIRGLGDGLRYDTTVIDGAPYNLNNFNPNLYNIEQVEVLRGPQGTLYGNSAQGLPLSPPETYTVQPNFTDRYDLGTTYNTTRIGTDLRYDPTALTPKYDTGSSGLNAGAGLGSAYNSDDGTPSLTTLGAGWDTTVHTDTPTAGTTTDTPTDADTNPASTTATTDHTPNGAKHPSPESNPGSLTGGGPVTTQNQPGAYDWGGDNTYGGGHGSPCDSVRIDWDRVRNQLADTKRDNAANTASGLIYQSQPRPFFDYNYYNTANDELVNRSIIAGQLTGGTPINGCYAGPGYGYGPGGYPDPRKPYVGGPAAPQVAYRVGFDFPIIPINNDDTAVDGGEVHNAGSSTTATELPPIPEYTPTVRPINAGELSDGLLGVEVDYGPGLIKHYLDEARKLRDEAKKYRERAEQWRRDAERARANAEASREKAKNAKSEDSRQFHEDQAETYDDHADILEDAATGLDRSAENNDKAAESFEADAAQSAQNFGEALTEQIHRQTQQAVKAAQEQAARDAEAARVEAERQKRLNDLMRRSQTATPSNNNQSNNAGSGGAGRPSGPDMREPQIGREPRNETIDKLLND